MAGCESRWPAVASVALLVATSCGPDDSVEVETANSTPTSTAVPSTDPTTTDPVSTDPPTGVVDIVDDTGIISATVPAEWSDTITSPDGEFRQLGAAADMDVFLATFGEPGMLILSGDVDDGDAAWRGALDAAVQSAREADGCVVEEELDYDDGIYRGRETLMTCPGTPTIAHFIAGTNGPSDVFFLLGIVRAEDDIAVRDLIVDTFFVD